MKTSRAALVASAIPLLLTSVGVTAGELAFNAPATEEARQSAPFLHETARVLHDSPPALGGQQISNLWLFPTADANTVFARYNLTGSSTEHLTILTLRDHRIVESRELTSPAARLVSKDSAHVDWSAAIGTGYAAHAGTTNASHGVPASPHWTANIGTGTAAAATNGVRDTKLPSSPGTRPAVAAAHWTSRIGRGDAS